MTDNAAALRRCHFQYVLTIFTLVFHAAWALTFPRLACNTTSNLATSPDSNSLHSIIISKLGTTQCKIACILAKNSYYRSEYQINQKQIRNLNFHFCRDQVSFLMYSEVVTC